MTYKLFYPSIAIPASSKFVFNCYIQTAEWFLALSLTCDSYVRRHNERCLLVNLAEFYETNLMFFNTCWRLFAGLNLTLLLRQF